MKRKSIFLTIVAIFFAGVTWAQLPAWPTSWGPGVKGSDTIFFCLTTDSLYPIELGYDVAEKHLSPEYGNWSLLTKTSESVTVDDYNLDGTKNGGAGNAYKAVGSGRGGLLFEYTASNVLCGLDPGEKFWVYVFILPDFSGSVSKDTLICLGSTPNPTDIEFSKSFADYADLYEKAGFTSSTWKIGGTISIKTDSIAKYTLVDSILLTGAPASYTCGLRGKFEILVTVDTIGQLQPIAEGICSIDTLGDLGKRNPINIFTSRQKIQGSYSPDTINNWTVAEKAAKWKLFTFTYKDCDATTKTVQDTLYIMSHHDDPANSGYWDKDTAIICRTGAPSNLFSIYDNYDLQLDFPKYPGRPGLAEGNSYWYDRALGVWPITDKGTTDGEFSMKGVLVPEDNGKELRLDSMKSNIGYHYLWRVDPGAFPCLVDPVTGIPDSGTVVLILQDPAVAIDYTAQLCKTGGYLFDLNAYTRLNVQWTGVNGTNGLEADNKTVKVDVVSSGTYKYKYTISAGCGAGGDGVFYLKVTTKIKAPSSKTVSYCVNKLPASINLNDVLGVAVSGLTWTSSLGAADGFNATTGILDIPTYVAKNGSTPTTLTFNTDSGEDCDVPNNTAVTIKFVTNLL